MKLFVVILLTLFVNINGLYHTSKSDQFIYDELNRVSFFHGANLVSKNFPYYNGGLLNKNNIKQMKSWGFNTVRLGVIWTGVEPEKGVYNETYINIMSNIIDELEKNDIHAIIDIHQDVLSTYFCLYDAFPTWFIDLSTSSKHEFPYPLKSDGDNKCPASRGWGANYFAESTGAAFQDLYDNTNGMSDHFSDFFIKIATSFKSKNILGYEIINEPWAGNIYEKPTLLLPGVAGRNNLQPLYNKISKAIRSVDNDHIILYEPVTWGMIFNGEISGSGFDEVPGGIEFADKSIFSFHYYCWWYQNTTFAKQTCDKLFGPKVFNQVQEDVQKMGGSYMLTEWGLGCDPANQLIQECNSIMDLADKHLISWTNWYFFDDQNSPSTDDWNQNIDEIKIFSRTFAKSVAGIPSKMHFNTNNNNFELCYNVDINISAPTEIYLNNDIHYSNGFNIHLNGNASDYLTIEIGSVESNQILISYDSKKGQMINNDVCVYVIAK
jgi:endoglycosylceramidase